MNKSQLNLQDIFLNQVRKENIGVTIYLVNSVQLRGMVRGFDAFTILLDSVGKPTQLVYKHAVTSIVPSRPVSNFYQEAHREAASERGDREHPREPREPREPVAPVPAPDTAG
ncbi:MAG TPA: RNA chaperone Hfq [Chthonomonadaceae bacterium]|nr:RNA chaperone Hfq [Chthonomonadaceae bacterium]